MSDDEDYYDDDDDYFYIDDGPVAEAVRVTHGAWKIPPRSYEVMQRAARTSF